VKRERRRKTEMIETGMTRDEAERALAQDLLRRHEARASLGLPVDRHSASFVEQVLGREAAAERSPPVLTRS
jgi:hypothetical protein